MNRKTNKNLKGRSLPVAPEDELFNQTDSDNSSSSNDQQLFKNQTLVMDLHGMQKDELPDNPLPEVQVKTRKLLKKKRPRPDQAQDQSAGSLTSSSESSVATPGPEKQEEFFDAHESYYNIQENQQSTTPNLLGVTSKQTDNPEALRLASPQITSQEKSVPESTAVSDATTAAAITQDTGTGRTPRTSAKPIRPSNPE